MVKQTERAALKSDLQNTTTPLCPILAKTIPVGIAYSHAGITKMERIAIENAFRSKTVCVLCCTATALESSMHLVANRIIIRAPYVGGEFVTNVQYNKMLKYRGIGKSCDVIVIFDEKDQPKLLQMLKGPSYQPTSDFHNSNNKGLTNLVLTAIGIGVAVCRKDLSKLLSKTLLSVQAPRLKLNLEQILTEVIRN